MLRFTFDLHCSPPPVWHLASDYFAIGNWDVVTGTLSSLQFHALISCCLDKHVCCSTQLNRTNAVIEIATLPFWLFPCSHWWYYHDDYDESVLLLMYFLFALVDPIWSRTGISACFLSNSWKLQSALVIFLLIYSFWWKQVDNKIENLWITPFLRLSFVLLIALHAVFVDHCVQLF